MSAFMSYVSYQEEKSREEWNVRMKPSIPEALWPVLLSDAYKWPSSCRELHLESHSPGQGVLFFPSISSIEIELTFRASTPDLLLSWTLGCVRWLRWVKWRGSETVWFARNERRRGASRSITSDTGNGRSYPSPLERNTAREPHQT